LETGFVSEEKTVK